MARNKFFNIFLLLLLDWCMADILIRADPCSKCEGTICRLTKSDMDLKNATTIKDLFDYYCSPEIAEVAKLCFLRTQDMFDLAMMEECSECYHHGRWSKDHVGCICPEPYQGRLCEDSSMAEKYRHHRLSMTPTTFWLLVLLLPAGAGILLCLVVVIMCRLRNLRAARRRAASVTSVRFQRVISQRHEAALSRFTPIDAQAMLQNKAIKEILCADDQ